MVKKLDLDTLIEPREVVLNGVTYQVVEPSPKAQARALALFRKGGESGTQAAVADLPEAEEEAAVDMMVECFVQAVKIYLPTIPEDELRNAPVQKLTSLAEFLLGIDVEKKGPFAGAAQAAAEMTT